MRDRFNRTIDYLRVSVTDRCNLRCAYCPPPGEGGLVRQDRVLSFEEITEVVQAAVSLGVRKVRLTGGEPLLRPGLPVLVPMLARIDGIDDLAMTTNAILLERYASTLAAAGLRRVNVSLDTLCPERFREITRGGDLSGALAGIEAAEAAGLTPIKLNCVVRESSDEPDARAVAGFGRARGYTVRFIREMDSALGVFSVVEGGAGGDCPRCNRLRLSCDGVLRPCLFSDLGFDVRALGISRALRAAVREKPAAGGPCAPGSIRRVGG